MADDTYDEAPSANAGYAAIPDGFVFIGPVDDIADLRKLLQAADDPEDIQDRPGYGFVVPTAVAKKAGFKAIETSTPLQDSTPADTVDVNATEVGPDPAENPDDPNRAANPDTVNPPEQTPADPIAAPFHPGDSLPGDANVPDGVNVETTDQTTDAPANPSPVVDTTTTDAPAAPAPDATTTDSAAPAAS